MLIYNSQGSDPMFKQTQAALPQIFCCKAVAQLNLGCTKNWVSPAGSSTTSEIFIQTRLSREHDKEIKEESNIGCDFVVPRGQKSKADLRQPALWFWVHAFAHGI